jgi:hypothetical protein
MLKRDEKGGTWSLTSYNNKNISFNIRLKNNYNENLQKNKV